MMMHNHHRQANHFNSKLYGIDTIGFELVRISMAAHPLANRRCIEAGFSEVIQGSRFHAGLA